MSNDLDDVQTMPAVIELAETYKVTAQAFVATMANVAMPKGFTKTQFVSCLVVAREHGLNPLTKEIYFMSSKGGAIQPIVGVDGWIRKCNEHQQFDGLAFKDIRNDKGDLVAMSCTIWRKDRSHPIEVTEDLDECARSGGPVWKSNPKRMLRNRVLCQCARIAFGFAGIMLDEEYQDLQRMKDITPSSPIDELPDIPDDPPEVPDIPDADGVPTDDECHDGFLAMLRARLAEGDPEEVWSEMEEVIGELPRNARHKAESIYAEMMPQAAE